MPQKCKISVEIDPLATAMRNCSKFSFQIFLFCFKCFKCVSYLQICFNCFNCSKLQRRNGAAERKSCGVIFSTTGGKGRREGGKEGKRRRGERKILRCVPYLFFLGPAVQKRRGRFREAPFNCFLFMFCATDFGRHTSIVCCLCLS